MKTLKTIILAIDNLNKIEGTQWKDFEDVKTIVMKYGNVDTENGKISREYSHEVLQRAIDTNGESVKEDAAEYERKLHGDNQTDSQWIQVLGNI